MFLKASQQTAVIANPARLCQKPRSELIDAYRFGHEVKGSARRCFRAERRTERPPHHVLRVLILLVFFSVWAAIRNYLRYYPQRDRDVQTEKLMRAGMSLASTANCSSSAKRCPPRAEIVSSNLAGSAINL
jgi:hypothetical protein